MKKFYVLFIALVLGMQGYSQFPTIRKCGTMENLEFLKSQDPGLQARMESQERKLQQYISENQSMLEGTKTVVTIPVVVHIVYNTSAQNVNDARVLEQINVLNTDYAGLNANGNMGGFAPELKANCEVQFCLAQRKPDGSATSGIERRQTSVLSFSTNNYVKYYSKGGLDAWDPTKYLNIWVCNLGNSLLGYAQFPTSGVNATFGVVILYSAFGLTGAVQPFHLGGTTTHELGHCLNLYHIWGDDGTACTGSDNCADTPNQAGYTSDCPTSPQISCSNGPLGNMYMNFMDYTQDACYNNFTPGQKARMQALFISGGLLAGLASSNGCTPPSTSCDVPAGLSTGNITATGASLGWGAVSAATAYSLQYKAAASTTWTTVTTIPATYTLSGLTASTTYNWKVASVCASGTSAYSAVVSFTTAATGCTDNYEANNTMAKAKTIPVATNIQALIATSTDIDWFKFSNSNTQKKIKITLTNLPADYDVELYKSNGTRVGISQNNGTTNETIIYNSGSKGTYYIKVYGYSGANNASQCYTLNASISSTNYRGAEGEIEEADTPVDLLVYPNPANSILNIDFNLPENEKAEIKLFDVSGRLMMLKLVAASKGMNHEVIDVTSMAKGIYFLDLYSKDIREVRRIILEK